MKKLLLTLICMVLFSGSQLALAQTAADAFGKYQSKEYKASGQLYDQFLKTGKGTATDYYNAACSWALAGEKDKAFGYLNQAVAKGWENKAHLQKDTDLASLHADKRWPNLIQDLDTRLAKLEANYNKPLKAQLEKIYVTDQMYRSQLDSIQKNFGTESQQWKDIWAKIDKQDEENKQQLIAILNQYGWPGKSLVGQQASQAAFLVIQHSDRETMEKYLPLLREAAAKGEASKSSLALMEDRVRMNRGLPQLYGSQMQMNPTTKKYELYKVEDEANLDKRRAEMGLGPISEYLKLFNQ
ncbi:hypothetical protein TH61_09315 [Rufibacter sp. DG15C]|uniref:DUF6624 domain-containing protein n=1 Tax=Rufibacter sp. DG15C TaxID=1379909 RepID=UPI00078CCB53|nr:DUF6624 domain-containing protein [Rufibacter sp. DG15C]AMM51331.1 hypothetical protein TH61_09315 [Rufibacter sp. DG15C]